MPFGRKSALSLMSSSADVLVVGGGIAGLTVALGIFAVLLALAIKVVIIGGLIYLAIRIFSPDTARRLRQKWSGSSY